MKPPGIALGVGEGGLTMHVTSPSRAEDKVWEAVEEAQMAGWTVEQFRRECAQAWEYAREEQLKSEMKDWR